MQTYTKHLFRHLATLAVIALAMVGTAIGQVSMPDITGRPGDDVVVDVAVTGVANLNSFQFTVNPTAGITYDGYVTSGTLSGTDFTVSPAATVTGNGTVIGGFYSGSGTPPAGEGTVIQLKFKLGQPLLRER
jgi:hypothetical protein